MNKKGQALNEMVFLMWKLALLFALVLVIVLSMNAVLTSKTDIRGTESILLGGEVMKCIAPEGRLNTDFKLEECLVGDEYFINVSAKSLDSNFTLNKFLGKEAIRVICGNLEQGTKVTNYPSCYEQDYFVLVNNKGTLEKAVVNLFIGITKTGEHI